MAASAEVPEVNPATHRPPEVARSNSGHHEISLSSERRQALISQVAYELAERRGFEPGHELEDWYAAEREVDYQLAAAAPVEPPESPIR